MFVKMNVQWFEALTMFLRDLSNAGQYWQWLISGLSNVESCWQWLSRYRNDECKQFNDLRNGPPCEVFIHIVYY